MEKISSHIGCNKHPQRSERLLLISLNAVHSPDASYSGSLKRSEGRSVFHDFSADNLKAITWEKAFERRFKNAASHYLYVPLEDPYLSRISGLEQ